MNVELKNALEKTITDFQHFKDLNYNEALAIFAKDIFQFISNISVQNSAERFNYFGKADSLRRILFRDLFLILFPIQYVSAYHKMIAIGHEMNRRLLKR